MKFRRFTTLTFPAALFFTASLFQANAADVTWDTAPDGTAITGGAGNWDTATTNWTTTAGATNVAWSNVAGDTATFSGTGGIVTLTAPISAAGLTFDSDGYVITAATPAATNLLTLSGGSLITVTNAGQTAEITSSIAGGTLNKAGAGTLLLNGSNTLSTVNVNAGTLAFNGAYAANRVSASANISVETGAIVELRNVNVLPTGTSAPNFVLNGGTLTAVSAAYVHSHVNNITLNSGAVWTTGAAAGSYNSENYQLNGNVTVGGTSASTISAAAGIGLNGIRTFTVADVTGDAANDLIVTANLNNNDAGLGDGIIKEGAGTMFLNNVTNSFTGNLTINAGTIRTGATQGGGVNSYLGAVSGSRTIAVKAGGTLSLGSNNTFGGGALTLASTPILALNGGTLTTSSFTTLGNMTLSNGALITHTVANTGTSAGYHAYQFRDGSTITVGGTSASTIAATGTAAYHVNGTVTFDVADVTASSAADLTVSARFINSSTDNGGTAGTLVKNGLGTIAFTNALAGSLTNNITINAGTVSFGGSGFGVDKMVGAGVITVNAGGTAVIATAHALGGDNTTFTESVILNGGSMVMNSEQYFSNLTLNNATISGTGQIRSAATTNFAVTGTAASTISSNVGIFTNANFEVANVTSSPAADLTITGTISQTGGTGLLVKSGAGTMAVTGSNTYTGGTSVTAGTLLVNNTTGSGLGTGAVTVTTGTLSGTGSFSGAVTIGAGGTLAPGASIESLQVGEVTFLDSSTFGVEVNSSTAIGVASDLLVSTGGLNLTGNVTLSLTDLAAATTPFATGTTFTLINYAGPWNGGTFAGMADDSTFTSGLNTWQINYNATTGGSNFTGDYSTGGNFVNITAVIPEPATALLAAVASLGLLRRRREK